MKKQTATTARFDFRPDCQENLLLLSPRKNNLILSGVVE